LRDILIGVSKTMPRVLIDNQPLFYRLSASDLASRRPPLLLLHGAGGTHMHWPAALRRLPDRNVYAIDLPGHGKSAGPGRDSIAAYCDVVYSFVQALGLELVTLAGHSMGGAVVQEFALHYPGRLAGIVLVGTGARLRVAPAILDGIRSDFPATVRAVADWVHDKNVPEQLKRLYVQRTLENDPQVMYGDFYACDQFDRRADVGRIATPALVICGVNDVMTPPKFSESLAQSLPNARLTLIPNAGHMVALEAPEEVTAVVAAFLRAVG
jgi:pimeloyl-ACP methyl ester carboxylesterase